MLAVIKRLFTADHQRYDGVPQINVYLMRLVYALMLVFLGKDSWTHIFSHQREWEPNEAMAWCVWAAFATLSLLGLFHTVRMIPLLFLEVFYKLLWLSLVAYPRWTARTLAGSDAEGMTHAFLWVVLPIVAIPWPYVFRSYVLGGKRKKHSLTICEKWMEHERLIMDLKGRPLMGSEQLHPSSLLKKANPSRKEFQIGARHD